MPWSAIMVTRKLCSMFAKYLTASVSAVTFPVQPGEPVIPCRRLHMRWHAILALILVASRSSVLRMEKSMFKYRYNICQSMHVWYKSHAWAVLVGWSCCTFIVWGRTLACMQCQAEVSDTVRMVSQLCSGCDRSPYEAVMSS